MDGPTAPGRSRAASRGGFPTAGEATWRSRPARKRGIVAVRSDARGPTTHVAAPAGLLGRLPRANSVSAGAFTIGGSLFALGVAVAMLGADEARLAASIYFVGGLFFNTGAYAALLGAINAPREVAGAIGARWRWWSYEPQRIDWASAFVLLAGTVAFGVSLTDSLLRGLRTEEANRLVWAPEVFGCVLFLVSGQLGMSEVCHRGRPCLHPRDLGWGIVATNQLGSVLFMDSALAAFTLPATASEVNVELANWGTLTGAVCFAVASVMQAFERPTAG